jgi:hypothetical protein
VNESTDFAVIAALVVKVVLAAAEEDRVAAQPAFEPDLPIPVARDTMPSVALRFHPDAAGNIKSSPRIAFSGRPLSELHVEVFLRRAREIIQS